MYLHIIEHVTARQEDLSISMHWILSPEPAVPQLDVPCVEDLLLSDSYLESTNKIQWLKDKMAMTPEQIEQVAQLTAGQRNNHLWALVRKNRLTASNFGSALAALRRNRFPPSLFKKIMCSYNLSKKDAIMWGTNNEAVARAKYCSFGDAVVEETGVWLHSSGVLGASPDGIIHRPATHNYTHQLQALADQLEAIQLRPEILEIKCPFTSRNMTIEEAINTSKDFCLEFQRYGDQQLYKLKEDHPYYDQVQGQLHILNKSACDFVVWTTKDIAIIRILQDSTWTPNLDKLIDFYFNNMLPVLQQ